MSVFSGRNSLRECLIKKRVLRQCGKKRALKAHKLKKENYKLNGKFKY